MRLADLPYSISDLFPKEDFAFTMKFRRGDVAKFFENSAEHASILEERKKWLRESPSRYTAMLPEAGDVLEEAIALARSVGVEVHEETLLGLGGAWEPDLLMLSASASEQPKLVAGCVCFPSSWSLEEKIGHRLDFIHKPVPTLNEQFASPIQQFMARMKPGISWERINWGLSRSPELNQHPARQLPRLDENVSVEEVWFRAEYQALVVLPQSHGVLFGIRLVIEPIKELQKNSEFLEGITRALRTMAEPIAKYKGLAPARERIVSLLND
jgi:dimethylamine monooxygenase subunit A